VEALKQAVLEFRDEVYKKKMQVANRREDDSTDLLVQLVNEEESLNEDKINLIYKHISSRATQILNGKAQKAALTMMEGVRIGGFDGEDGELEVEEGAAFDIQETEFAFGPRSKRQICGQKKRSNSFKLGSRPREMKE